MEERVKALIETLTGKYQAVRACSEWDTLKLINNIGPMTALLDNRARLLDEIVALPPLSTIAPETLNTPCRAKYDALIALVREITETDQWMMDKINERMNDIRNELKAKTLFRSRALPGYMRQKFALA